MDISSLRERDTLAPLTVTALNNRIKALVETDRALSAISVTGEISNITHHRSGHVYFSLKDADSQIRAVMFRSARMRLNFVLEDGMKVTVHGSVSLYAQNATVQLYANSITPDGIGELYKAYEQLKSRLADEGLFDVAHKQEIPRFPRKIGVITSPTGAAVRDIINVTSRRYPLADIYLYPSLVQGENAEQNLVKALDYLDSSKLVDIIIIGRGGGSIEDLWAFNSEKLARRIFEAKTPVISAVGHETDFTICDFVSDLRAPTPSAAAEQAVPDIRDLRLMLDDAAERLALALKRTAERKRQRLSEISERAVFTDPTVLLSHQKESIQKARDTAELLIGGVISSHKASLSVISGKLDALSPLAVLARGFSLVQKNGVPISSIKQINDNDEVKIRLSDGSAVATITEVRGDNENG